MRKLTCPCDQVFSVDFPESVNLDSAPETTENIKNGSFLSCICPSCNAVLHTEFNTRFEWPSKKVNIKLIPEVERVSFLSGNMKEESDVQIVIGFAELSDRISVLENNLDPLIIEAIKYHLVLKASENNPEAKIIILFEGFKKNGDLEFHIHGLKTDQVAVTLVPSTIYETLKTEAHDHPEAEPFASLVNGSYVSVQNILIEEIPNV